MLIAATGDTHIDGRDPHATLDEQVEWLCWIADDAAAHGAELLLHGGDVYERTSTPEERAAAATVFSHWCSKMRLGVVVAKGNHDVPLDLDLLGRLRTSSPLFVCEEPARLHLEGVSVSVLPWPRRAWLAARMEANSRMDLSEAATAGLRAILAGFATGWRGDVPRVVLSHAELGAASLDSGQPVAARCDVALSEADLLATGADLVALAHIHKSQTLGGGRIRYPGSPRATAFGQDDDPKGYSLVEVRRGETPVIAHRLSPARPLVTVDAEWNGAQLSWDRAPTDIPPDAAVRLRYEVPEDVRQTAAANAEAFSRALGDRVKIDARVTTVHRVRSEQIRTARTLSDRLEAYWASRGDRPQRAEHIVTRLGELEAA